MSTPAYFAERRARLTALGRCWDCGSKTDTKTRCEPCVRKHAQSTAASRTYYERNNPRTPNRVERMMELVDKIVGPV